jgi:flagellar protein FlgJ
MSLPLQNPIHSQIQLSNQLAQRGMDLDQSSINSPEQLKAVAQEFESLFLNMMLKSMRSANRTLSEGNYFSSFESKMYEDMLDEKLSVELSGFGSLGIGDLLVKQFSADTTPRTYDLKMEKPSADLFPSERRAAFDSREQFIVQLLPEAESVAKQLGIEPQFIVAQAALETGWGQHVMFDGNGQNSFNLFGIKARPDWQGKSVAIESMEVKDGIAAPVKSAFKMYDSYEEGLEDYRNLLQSDRYSAVVNSESIYAFGSALRTAGYATDPEYGQKLTRVYESIHQVQLAAGR